MNYAHHHHIILKLNEKNNKGSYPLLEAINNNNIEIVKLLMDCAHHQNII